ncbi:putative secretion ATPase, PEP-CTERM locus subfamily [Ruegeria atlantica]|uniref:Putative secretion ATPase, PEP-CTERM locus subfamily n=2 Tax=Ruegeria atlantica TaxID=81569 RepID=A0A0P1F6R2_9RHOB|nr:putative secretion ATPase, PEP-CTERM locus subfamily [Ruegeria atlantica]
MTTGDLYIEHFGLRERPFTLLPDPSFLYWSTQHKRAYSILEFGVISKAPITLITGEIGAGKTTLLQKLISQIDDDVTIGLVSNAQGGRGELLQWALNALDVPATPRAPYVQLYQTLASFLISEYAEGRRVVLIFDEAQNLSREGLEEIRMLTNINSNKDELIQLILVGQPELRDVLLQPKLRQMAQRVAASFHLPRMDAETVSGYIEHRVKVAGGTGEEFSAEACDLIHAATEGVPRLVNQICEFAMLYAWSEELHLITPQIVRSVLDDGVCFGAISVSDPEEVGQVLKLGDHQKVPPEEKAG